MLDTVSMNASVCGCSPTGRKSQNLSSQKHSQFVSFLIRFVLDIRPVRLRRSIAFTRMQSTTRHYSVKTCSRKAAIWRADVHLFYWKNVNTRAFSHFPFRPHARVSDCDPQGFFSPTTRPTNCSSNGIQDVDQCGFVYERNPQGCKCTNLQHYAGEAGSGAPPVTARNEF